MKCVLTAKELLRLLSIQYFSTKSRKNFLKCIFKGHNVLVRFEGMIIGSKNSAQTHSSMLPVMSTASLYLFKIVFHGDS